MGEVIDIRRGRKRHWVTLQSCPKTAYELGIEDEQGNVNPQAMVDFMHSAEFYLLCKGARGLYIPLEKRPSDKKRRGGRAINHPEKNQPPDKRRPNQ